MVNDKKLIKLDAAIVLTSFVCSHLRSCDYNSTRLSALSLLLALSMYLTDEHRLERVIPFMVYCLADDSPLVRASSILYITQILEAITSITTADANIFQEYLIPSFKPLAKDPSNLVRGIYAQCLGHLAEQSIQFLDLAQMLKLEVPVNVFQLSYDASLNLLKDLLLEDISTLLLDGNPMVRRMLLYSIPRLCVLFGRLSANEVFLSHIITYLNDPDPRLRAGFFETIVAIAAFVGGKSFEEYILPLMVQSLTDSEESVIERVLVALKSLLELGLVHRYKMREVTALALPFVYHPNAALRLACIQLIVVTAHKLPLLDVHCMFYPILRQFLQVDIPDITLDVLKKTLKPPLSPLFYDQVWNYAKNAPVVKTSIQMSTDSQERNQDFWKRLQEMGMTLEDKQKIFTLKYYIFKASQQHNRLIPDHIQPLFNMPQTVFIPMPQVYEEFKELSQVARIKLMNIETFTIG
jgi:phosphoinositide-3-kinase regulatory subunit 4